MTRAPVVVVAMAAVLTCACLPASAAAQDWQQDPGWELLRGGNLAGGAYSFASRISALPKAERYSETAEGLGVGWSASIAGIALDLLRQVRRDDPDSDEGRSAAKLLEMLWQDDAERALAWRRNAPDPWGEALVGLLDIYGVAQSEYLMQPPRIVTAADGTRYRWTGRIGRGQAPGAIEITEPDGRTARYAVDRTLYDDEHAHLAVSADESRLYIASRRGIVAFAIADLRDEPEPLWRFQFDPKHPELTAVSVAVSRDGSKLFWGYKPAGLGVLDANTGKPLDGPSIGDGEVLPDARTNACVSADGKIIYMPAVGPKTDKAPSLPGGGTYEPYEMIHKYWRVASWVGLDADTGEIADRIANPWAPANALGGPTASTAWAYTHSPPDWCPSLPKGTAYCGLRGNIVALVDLEKRDVLSAVLCPQTGKWSLAAGGGHTSFAPPVMAATSSEEYDAARQAYELARYEPGGLATVLEWTNQGSVARFRAAIGLLAAATCGPEFPQGGWRQSKWLSGKYKMPMEIKPNTDWRVANNATAWRGLWCAYLRYFGFTPPDKDATAEPTIVDTETETRIKYIKIPYRFKPGGVTASEDGKWLYVGDDKDIAYREASSGRLLFKVGPVAHTVWDLVPDADSQTAFAICGPGVYGALEFDLDRGRTLRHYELGPLAFAIPSGDSHWLVAPGNYVEKGLWLLNTETGIVERTVALPEGIQARYTGCLGFGEDGESVLVPCEIRRKVRRTWETVPLWLTMSRKLFEFGKRLELENVLTPEGLAAVDAAKQRNPKLMVYVPGSSFPSSSRDWTVSERGEVYVAGGMRTRVVRAPASGAGTGTTTITIWR